MRHVYCAHVREFVSQNWVRGIPVMRKPPHVLYKENDFLESSGMMGKWLEFHQNTLLWISIIPVPYLHI